MKLTRVSLCLLGAILLSFPACADTLRVVSYNILNFRGEQDADRIAYFRRTVDYLNPDVVAMQEIISESAVDYLLSFAFLPDQSDWAAAQFTDGPDTDNMLFYRTSKVSLVSQRYIWTDPRYINEYVLRPVSPDTSQRIRIYSAHLKAGDTPSDAQRRAGACSVIRAEFDLLETGALFVMVGDFNLYTSEEEAYQILLSPSPDPDGQLFDPIDEPGAWNNSAGFADIHTQSSRTTSFGGGASGGMDDRFDFILASTGLMDTAGTYILPETYHAVGNDGLHFNQSINDGVNYAVPDSIADALYYGTDHLPVAVDIILRANPTAVDEPPVVQNYQLLSCYPNPFNSTLTIQIANPHFGTTLSIHDLLGRRVYEQPVNFTAAGHHVLNIDFSPQTSGVYYIRLQSPVSVQSQKVILIR